MTQVALQEPDLISQVLSIAREEGRTAEAFVREAVQREVMAYRQRRIGFETDSWYQMPSEIREQYEGQLVAIYRGEIVDCDTDRLTLLQRIGKKYGREPVAIIPGGTQPMPTYRFSSVRMA